jgi:hypothetical protein
MSTEATATIVLATAGGIITAAMAGRETCSSRRQTR